MPVTIGAKRSPDFCFLAVLVKVASQAKGSSMTNRQSHEWKQALDSFRDAAPRHTADEEESLFPRLRQLNQPEVERALVEIQELEADQ
jgi:hemerythrin superfamily protein